MKTEHESKTEQETITRINGNGRPYTVGLPKLVMLGACNDVALAHIFENTGLRFERHHWGFEAQPTSSQQIAALFMTYNFKTRYFDNADTRNSIFLKSDHHIGFQVDSICSDCAKHNRIPGVALKPGDRLAA